MQVGDLWDITINHTDQITIVQADIDGMIAAGLDPNNDAHVKAYFENGIRLIPERMIGRYMVREHAASRSTEFPAGSVTVNKAV